MLLLGIDVGTSSIKVSVVDSETQRALVSAQYPETESEIKSVKPGWAEQSPEMWWDHVQKAILKANALQKYDPSDITAIGIAYQMHGLVMVDKEQQVIRDSIIWCDSRAVDIGNTAFREIGEDKALSRLLNSPANFTASKLAWVKMNEPANFSKIYKIMLPGDFIAMRLTGDITCSVSSLSEGIFWDFQSDTLSDDIISHYGFSKDLFPDIKPVFSEHGYLSAAVAERLSLRKGIPVTYKSGDQPNNALSLNVLEPGEVAATAGTSGVIYGISDELTYDKQSRVNTFAHVNYQNDHKRLGVLLCINGTGILNRWVRDTISPGDSYVQMNKKAAEVAIGSEGLRVFPFGNGAERMLGNKIVGAHFRNIDLNVHGREHIYRASQEGIAFAFRYGLDIMRENGMNPTVIRAGKANLFQSPLFTEAFVNATNVPVELHDNDGSVGAALGAGMGVNAFKSAGEAFQPNKTTTVVEPHAAAEYEEVYADWKTQLEKELAHL